MKCRCTDRTFNTNGLDDLVKFETVPRIRTTRVIFRVQEKRGKRWKPRDFVNNRDTVPLGETVDDGETSHSKQTLRGTDRERPPKLRLKCIEISFYVPAVRTSRVRMVRL